MAHKNPDNEQMAILEGPEDDPKMDLCGISIRRAENVEGKPGFIVNCSYRMKPDEIDDETPYEKRHRDEDYISTTKDKALKYVDEKMDTLLGKSDDNGAPTSD